MVVVEDPCFQGGLDPGIGVKWCGDRGEISHLDDDGGGVWCLSYDDEVEGRPDAELEGVSVAWRMSGWTTSVVMRIRKMDGVFSGLVWSAVQA